MNDKIKEPAISDEIHDYEKLKPPVKSKGAVESFKYAVDGILDVFRTQKHMRFHFVTVVLVLLVALMFGLDKKDILVLLFTISLVLVAEMINTSIEAVVDLVTQTYHPLAKFAKDAAAGAVLIATGTSVLVGCVLFLGDQTFTRLSGARSEGPGSLMTVLISGLALLVIVTIMKVLGSRGKLLKGGICSGHSAAGFFLAATALYFSRDALTAIVAIIMALLIAQSRVEAKIHTIQEVITGALVAMLLTALVYWFVPTFAG